MSSIKEDRYNQRYTFLLTYYPISWSMAAILRDSVAVVVRTSRTLSCVYCASNTASHENHEKINSWVSFAFLNSYCAPLGGPLVRRSSAMKQHSLCIYLLVACGLRFIFFSGQSAAIFVSCILLPAHWHRNITV